MMRRWNSFKAREPNGRYSYVWWETILMFSFSAGFIVSFLLSLFVVIELWVVAFGFWFLDFYWSRREIKGREKYFERQKTGE